MNYLLKRLLWSVPTLFAVVIIGFVLLVYSPGDPIDTVLGIGGNEDPLKPASPFVENQKRDWEEKLGLNLPLFYITIQSSALPDTLYKIPDKKERNIIRTLCLRTGQPNQVMNYRIHMREFKTAFAHDLKVLPDSLRDPLSDKIEKISHNYNLLIYETDQTSINHYITELYLLCMPACFSESQMKVVAIMKATINFKTGQYINVIIPSVQFHKKSRFHQWFFGGGKYSKGIIRGDFGISYVSKEPIKNHIYKNLFWSILFSGIGILLAYLISIPIGIYQATHNNMLGEKITTVLLFALYSIPVFFLGTLLQTYLANHQYLHIFEPTGIKPTRGFTTGSNVFERIWQTLPYMILPIICFTYSSIAFLTKLTKTSILDTLHQPYITTAKAKGLPFKKIIYKHAFRNALIPLITVFANIFPLLVGGSVIIESIFTIPGMGTEMFTAYFSHNIPVIISIFTLTGIFTVIGFFISDILYVLVDPRIRK
jgi:peptide/nickel transport system permease protein